MWIPKPAYEALPYALLLGGVIAIAGAFGVSRPLPLLVVACGLMLVASSVIILKMRKDARMRARRRAALKTRLRYGTPSVFSPWGVMTHKTKDH